MVHWAVGNRVTDFNRGVRGDADPGAMARGEPPKLHHETLQVKTELLKCYADLFTLLKITSMETFHHTKWSLYYSGKLFFRLFKFSSD